MIIGIDPGKYGAIAIINDEGKLGFAKNIPLLGKEFDLLEINNIFCCLDNGDVAYIEKVNSFGMGRQSAFVFGYGVGLLEMAIISNGIKLNRVTPQKWQKAIFSGIPKQKDKKKMALQCLKEKYPDDYKKIENMNLNKKLKEGIIDAILIARYGFMQQKGGDEF